MDRPAAYLPPGHNPWVGCGSHRRRLGSPLPPATEPTSAAKPSPALDQQEPGRWLIRGIAFKERNRDCGRSHRWQRNERLRQSDKGADKDETGHVLPLSAIQ